MKPYYDHAGITIYHGDCREILPTIQPGSVDLVLTDPPYGISYNPNHSRCENAPWFGTSIRGDGDTAARDAVIEWAGDCPWAIFGTWKAPRPASIRGLLIWDKGPAPGSGDLNFPWKLSHEEIYISGPGWTGHRGESVLKGHWIVTWHNHPAGRDHPNQKPVSLIREILYKAPAGLILDPFMGSGTTLVAAKQLGRRAIGIEIEEKYCEIAVRRLAQEVLPMEPEVRQPEQIDFLDDARMSEMQRR